MDQQETGSKPVSRTVLYVIPLMIAVLAIALSAWWVFASRQAAAAMDQWLARELAAGREWTCKDRIIGGYPFRIELECPALSFKAKDGAVADVKVGRVLAVWQIYQPSLIIVEFDRAMAMTFRSGTTRELKTGSLRMSLHFDTLDLPDRLALVGENVEMPNVFSSNALEFHLVRGVEESEPNDLRLYVETQNTVIEGLKRDDAKPMMIMADARASEGAVLYSHSSGSVLDRWREAGGKLQINGVKITRGEGDLQMKGTLAFDETHRLNGKLDMKANGFSDLLDAIGLQAGGFSLNAKAMSLPLALDRGRIFLGPLKIGEIGPLY